MNKLLLVVGLVVGFLSFSTTANAQDRARHYKHQVKNHEQTNKIRIEHRHVNRGSEIRFESPRRIHCQPRHRPESHRVIYYQPLHRSEFRLDCQPQHRSEFRVDYPGIKVEFRRIECHTYRPVIYHRPIVRCYQIRHRIHHQHCQ